MIAVAVVVFSAVAQTQTEQEMGRPPEPSGGFRSDDNGRPPEPPGGFRGGPMGGRRGDDPSDPSRYSGIVTVDGVTTNFADRAFVSAEKNKSPLYAKNGGKATVRRAFTRRVSLRRAT